MKKYLLVPVMPTPNGPLHLGHISGPFLRMDVLARCLRQIGHDVSIVSASDPWETHALLRGLTTDTPPEQICHHYHGEIASGLAALNINYDKFINVLEPPWNTALPNIANDVLAALAKQPGALRVIKERVPYSSKHKMPLTGALIEGACPKCGASMGGFFCESCGAEISPSDLVKPRSRLPDDNWEWRSYDSLYLQVRDVAGLRSLAERICADRRFVEMAFDGLAFNNNLVRLTHPGTWGIHARAESVSPDSVIFSYPALFTLSLLCARATTAKDTAFAPSSDVITIKSFGIDNSIPYIVSVLAIMQTLGNVKPFEHYLTNYFSTLDGKKFSTSRNHAIWALDSCHLLKAKTDTIRAYLTKVNPQYSETDFSVAEFGTFKAQWEDRLERNIATALSTPCDQSNNLDHLARLFEQRNAALDPARFALAEAMTPIEEWVRLADNGVTHSWALGFSVLAWPIMPELSERIWRMGRMPNLPTFDKLLERLKT
jgi:methionyl-tRNA synthetase